MSSSEEGCRGSDSLSAPSWSPDGTPSKKPSLGLKHQQGGAAAAMAGLAAGFGTDIGTTSPPNNNNNNARNGTAMVEDVGRDEPLTFLYSAQPSALEAGNLSGLDIINDQLILAIFYYNL